MVVFPLAPHPKKGDVIKWLYEVCDLRDEARRPCGGGLIMTYDDLLYVSVQCTVDDSPFVHCKSFLSSLWMAHCKQWRYRGAPSNFFWLYSRLRILAIKHPRDFPPQVVRGIWLPTGSRVLYRRLRAPKGLTTPMAIDD